MKKILVENTPGIGDLIMLTPCLRKIKEIYPDSELTVVSYTNNLPVILGLPYIDKIYGINKKNAFGRIKLWPCINRQEQIIFTSWQPRLALMAFISGVKRRAGICRNKYAKTGLFTHIMTEDNIANQQSKATIFASQISQALEQQMNIDLVCDVVKSTEYEQHNVKSKMLALGYKDNAEYIVIAPKGKTAKDLAMESITASLEFILGCTDYTCVFINDVPLKSSRLFQEMHKERIIDLTGQTTLREMLALLENARMLIATDSGPMHIACALSTPTVAVFSTSTPARGAPPRFCFPVYLSKEILPYDSGVEAVSVVEKIKEILNMA